jgi:hypothetical protein
VSNGCPADCTGGDAPDEEEQDPIEGEATADKRAVAAFVGAPLLCCEVRGSQYNYLEHHDIFA